MRIGIIGGGASGMMAAISIKRNNNDASVTIIEANEILGKKILATGNGKCNFTNINTDAKYYNKDGADFINSSFKAFSKYSVISLFESMGIKCRCKGDYVYPMSERAGALRRALENEIKRLNIEVKLNHKVQKINHEVTSGSTSGKRFIVITEEGGQYVFDKLIVSTGGNAGLPGKGASSGYRFAGTLGHKIIPTVPALVQLEVKDNILKSASGVRINAKAEAYIDDVLMDSSTGELQISDYGLSGILIFQISGCISRALHDDKKCEVRLDFLNMISEEDLIKGFINDQMKIGYLNILDYLNGYFTDKLSVIILKTSGVSQNNTLTQLDSESIKSIVMMIKYFKVNITQTKGYKNAQITSGGVVLSEINPDTMESRVCNDLYITGELLNIDGKCGGFNLHFAWVSGYLAGLSAAKK
ncbi:MAG: NAD(P)/FAD-dependent oxidoreductase [Suipraeoptans sp.]